MARIPLLIAGGSQVHSRNAEMDRYFRRDGLSILEVNEEDLGAFRRGTSFIRPRSGRKQRRKGQKQNYKLNMYSDRFFHHTL
jgi:hypothetical protein